MNYVSDRVSIFSLKLDPMNPRFIVAPNPSQEEIRRYLLEYEEIGSLATGINENEGLMIGERIIICKENGENIVLEGNRRVCACQLLLNRDLIPEEYKHIIPTINENTKINISSIDVDIATSREGTQVALATRHIDGIRQWSTVSKQKFYANSFSGGKTIDYISKITSTDNSKVRKGIEEHNLLKYALELPKWSIEEKRNYLNIQMIKPTLYLKAFTTKSETFNNQSARNILKLSFNNSTLIPISKLPSDIFDEAIYLIAKACYIDKTYNTRNVIDEVPGFIELMQNFYNSNEKNVVAKDNPNNEGNKGKDNPNNEDNESKDNPNNKDNESKDNPNNEDNESKDNPNNEDNESKDNPNNEGNKGKDNPNNEGNKGKDNPNNKDNESKDNPNNKDNESKDNPNNKDNESKDNPNNEDNESKDNPNNKDNESKDNPNNKDNESKDNPNNEDNESKDNPNNEDNESKDNPNNEDNESKDNPNPKSIIKLLSDLTWSGVSNTDSENIGILNICTELKKISEKNHYRIYPIATTILVRSLLEQSLIYHLKKVNMYDTLIRRNGGNFNRIPPLEKVLDFYNKNTSSTIIFRNDTFKRMFTSFYSNIGTKDYMDMVIHNPDLVGAKPDILDNIVDSGLGNFIKEILNNNYNS